LLDLAQSWPESLPDTVPAPVKYRTMKQLRPSEVSRLVDGYQSGATIFELAGQFGIHRATVGIYLRARGVDTTPPALRPEDVPTVVEPYQTGWWSLQRIGGGPASEPERTLSRFWEVRVGAERGLQRGR
jgi:hypothetical protein